MAFQHVDMQSAMRRLAEQRIEEAMREGKSDNLPGRGQALDLEPMPAEENARLAWWCIRLLKQNDVTPEEVRWRKRIDLLEGALSRADSESHLLKLVEQINDLVRRINTLGTNALKAPVVPLSADAELARFRARRDE